MQEEFDKRLADVQQSLYALISEIDKVRQESNKADVEAARKAVTPILNLKSNAEDDSICESPVESINLHPGVVVNSGFVFSKKSLNELSGVKPELVSVAALALKFCKVDFMVFDGLRTKEEQALNVKNGASRTMNSKHLIQPDNYGHAVDLVPVVNGIPKWNWDLIYPVACAMDFAATKLGVANKIRWGGAWDRTLADFGGDESAYKRECEAYCARHPGKDFIDGPHFEWIG